MKFKRVFYVFLSALLVSCASSKPSYWNKPSVSWDQYQRDEKECTDIVMGVKPKDSPPTYTMVKATPQNAAIAGDIAGALIGFQEGQRKSEIRQMNYDTCLRSRGYTKRALTADENRNFNKLPKQEQLKQLEAWLTTSEPTHPILPED